VAVCSVIFRRYKVRKVAIVGDLKNLGRELLSILEENGWKSTDVAAVENRTPLGTTVSYGEDDEIDVENLDDFDFSKVDGVIFATSEAVTKRHLSKALDSGAKIVDCSGASFENQQTPMIIASINDSQIEGHSLVGVPCFFVTQMLLPLQKIVAKYEIKRIVTSTYTSTSVYGKEAMDELFNQTRKIFMNEPLVDNQAFFGKQIAFNVLPQIGDFMGDETHAEWQINAESKKVLGKDIKIHANCAIIPAFVGAAQYINVECANEVDADEIKKLMGEADGVVVFDKNVDGGYVSLTDVQGEDNVYVSRVRQDVSVEDGFSFWCVADNVRATVAQNAFRVLKLMLIIGK